MQTESDCYVFLLSERKQKVVEEKYMIKSILDSVLHVFYLKNKRLLNVI